MSGKIRALGLLSGGLDSTLSARILQEQDIEVLGLHFSTGFCVADRHRLIGNTNNPDKPYRNEALRAGADLQIPVELIDKAQLGILIRLQKTDVKTDDPGTVFR